MLGSPASALHPPTPTPTPKQADIWSYGVLVWELASGQDITRFQPLSMARQIQAGGASGGVGSGCYSWRYRAGKAGAGHATSPGAPDAGSLGKVVWCPPIHAGGGGG